jgi:5-methylcytosine-specific restriction protein A
VADHWPRDRRELERLGLDPDDPQHGRGLCASCHGKHTAKTQPGGFNARARSESR